MTVFDKHEKLQQKFKELYCACYLLGSIEDNINKYIRKQLGEDISNKIESIELEDFDSDGFLLLTIFVNNSYSKEVLAKVKEVFPGWEWYAEKNTNFSDIYLRLDDDVVANIPQFMYEAL